MSFRKKIRSSLESAGVTDASNVVDLEPADTSSELRELGNTIEDDLGELDSINDKMVSLEELVSALESAGGVNESTYGLSNLVYRQVVRNTSLENVSVEAGDFLRNAKDVITSLAKRAVEILKGIWRSLEDLFNRTFSMIPRRIAGLEKLKGQIKEKDEAEFAKEIPLTGKVFAGLHTGVGKVNLKEIFAAIKTLQDESGWYLTTYMDAMADTQRKMLAAELDIEKMAKAALPHYDTMRKRYPTIDIDGYDVGESGVMPGGYNIRVTIATPLQMGRDIKSPEFAAAANYAIYKTKIAVTHEELHNERTANIDVMSKSDLLRLIEDAIEQLKLVERHREKYNRFRKETEKYWDTFFVKSTGSSAERYANNDNTKNNYQRMCMAYTAFARWLKEPANALISISVRFSGAVADYAASCAKVKHLTEEPIGNALPSPSN